MLSSSKPGISKAPDFNTTIDGFLDNSFFVSQAAKGPHRSGLDAVLLAATISPEATGKAADFGAGSGVAGMAVAQRCPGVHVDLIEVDPGSLVRARASIGLPQNAHIAERLNVIEADLTLRGIERETVGLQENSYDHIISNPPYNDLSYQPSPDAYRARAHVMEPDMLEKWVKTAVFVARPKAQLTLIMRPSSLAETLNCLGGRFGSIRVKPVQPTSETPAMLILIRAEQGGRAPMTLLPALAVRADEGRSTDEAEEIFRGRAGITL